MPSGHGQGFKAIGTPPEATSPVQEEMDMWLDCAQQAAGLSGSLVRLAGAELNLALASSRRLFMLGLLLVPIVLFAWIGISAMIAWLGYLLGVQLASHAGAVTLGIASFTLLQLGVVALLVQKCRQSRSNMRFAETRKHFKLFRQGLANGIQRPHSESEAA